MAKYTTNFIQTNKGNAIQSGKKLIITVKNADVVSSRLDQKLKGVWKTIQVAQKEGDTVSFLLKGSDKKDLPTGKYRIHTWVWKNKRGSSYVDEFEIV